MKQKYFLLIFSICLSTQILLAQNESSVRFFKTGQENGAKLFKAYMASASEGLGFALNNGWYQTADIKKPGRFNLKLIGGLSFSQDAETFDIRALGLNNVVLSDENIANESPTVMKTGGEEGQTVAYISESDTLSEFTLPTGLGFVPALVLQANIGLPYRTELMLRVLPNAGADVISSDAGGSLWGFGLKHDIQQWIPKVNLWSVRLALAFGYTHFEGNLAAFSRPDIDPSTGTFYPQATGVTPSYDNQSLQAETNAFNFALLLSKRIYAFTIYTGLRYDRSKMTIDVLGTYPYTDKNSAGEKQTFNIENPLSFSQTFKQISFNAGLRFKLGPAQLFVDGSVGKKFININGGIGFGWGKH